MYWPVLLESWHALAQKLFNLIFIHIRKMDDILGRAPDMLRAHSWILFLHFASSSSYEGCAGRYTFAHRQKEVVVIG